MCGLAPNSSRILTAPASPLAAAQDNAVRPSVSVSSIVDVDNLSCCRRSLFTRPRTVLWMGGKVRDSKYSSSSNRQRQASIVRMVGYREVFPKTFFFKNFFFSFSKSEDVCPVRTARLFKMHAYLGYTPVRYITLTGV